MQTAMVLNKSQFIGNYGRWTTQIHMRLSESYVSPEDEEARHPHKHIVMSVAYVGSSCNRWECYAFPADEDGNITGWIELPFSKNHTNNWLSVMREAGYAVIDEGNR